MNLLWCAVYATALEVLARWHHRRMIHHARRLQGIALRSERLSLQPVLARRARGGNNDEEQR